MRDAELRQSVYNPSRVENELAVLKNSYSAEKIEREREIYIYIYNVFYRLSVSIHRDIAARRS